MTGTKRAVHPLKINPAEIHTVEIIKYGPGDREEDEAAFTNLPDAEAFAQRMVASYGYRVWVNGIEFRRRDFKDSDQSL